MPVVFARKLLSGTRNPTQRRPFEKLVQNGPDQRPGANWVETQELRAARSARTKSGFREATSGHCATTAHNTGTKVGRHVPMEIPCW